MFSVLLEEGVVHLLYVVGVLLQVLLCVQLRETFEDPEKNVKIWF